MIGSAELFILGARELTLAAEADIVRYEGHRTAFTISDGDDTDPVTADAKGRPARAVATRESTRVGF